MRLDHWSVWSIFFSWQCDWWLKKNTIWFWFKPHDIEGSGQSACLLHAQCYLLWDGCLVAIDFKDVLLLGCPFIGLRVLWVFILVIRLGKQNVFQDLLCVTHFDRHPCLILAGVHSGLPSIYLNVHLFLLIICKYLNITSGYWG